MEHKDFNWTTSFDTSQKTMTHHFNDRVEIVVNFQYGFITKVIDGNEVEKIGFDKGYSLSDYMEYQNQVATEAEQYRKE